jgi:hypothetical protein
MKIFKLNSLFFIIVLILIHFFTSGTWLVAALLLAGIVAGFLFRNRGGFLQSFFAGELLAGLVFVLCALFIDGHNIQAVTKNAGISANLLLLATVLINVIAALICTGLPVLFIRWFVPGVKSAQTS